MAATTTSRLNAEEVASVVEEEEEEDEEDGDCFFESLDRIPSSVSFVFAGDGSSDSDEDDARASFASAVAPPPEFRHFAAAATASRFSSSSPSSPDQSGDDADEVYGIWMSAPLSIEERRRRLLQGMGLASGKDLSSAGAVRVTSSGDPSGKSSQPPASSSAAATPSWPSPSTLFRSISDAGVAAERDRTQRREQLLGTCSPRSFRASSAPPSFSLSRSVTAGDNASGGRRRLSVRRSTREVGIKIESEGGGGPPDRIESTNSADGRLFTIKDLDTGKEFVIDELLEDGTWNRLSDPKTGLRLSIEEFERSLGYSPIVRELMRRANVVGAAISAAAGGRGGLARHASRARGKSVKSSSSKRKGIGWLKNIRGVANSVTGLVLEKEREAVGSSSSRSAASSSAAVGSSERMKVRQHGKPYRELTGLYMCQEIQAHEGSIWSIKFSPDGRYLASAGEDRVIHVWEVVECSSDGSSSQRLMPGEQEAHSASHQLATTDGSQDRPAPLEVRPSQRMRKGKASGRKRSSIPDYVVPGDIFSLSQKPICSFRGHLDDVLDLSWSKSQYLLSSSMDKTVRLWDMDSKACLKLFAHNDYVTCIQFNPVDDRYFISGSLDAKVRIWSIPDRQVVDWSDLHEMVTAACYTPDGQGALVGSHKGSCRFYSTSDGKLHQKAQIDIHNKKRKSHAKKVTGFQFAPGNPSEVLVTSADSQIRVFDGVDLIQKFRGFRNTSSQISASFTADGNYIICASEDSHVYVWKREDIRNMSSSGKGKSWITTRSHEHFHCKDVSVAIPWPPGGSSKCNPPSLPSWSRRHNDQIPQRSPDSRLASSSMITANEDVFVSCRSVSPPLPKKSFSEKTLSCLEEEPCNPSRSGSGLGSSASIPAPHWLMSGALSSISAFGTFTTSFSSSQWYGGVSNRSSNQATTAWGLVVVTAGLGGEIKIYKNFGLPRLPSRQNHLF